ncbi:NmrA family NAD(P)-binding protein [Embleya sp. NBC_00896]|uniref:NmrA family NAD(P)-binding protein n=1 Tax=Embleya sp. NBC_00896 TaxID=2975961 RepID=UPI002F90DB99|nr:NmrA family NAD(P)-binding protein [Embleya sp. NBC_00896]
MIAVMGASGATGGALLARLAELGVPARALTRHPEPLRAALADRPHHGNRVDVVRADAEDPDTLRSAFTGTRQVFLAMANGPRQVELECDAVDMAVECGVEHIVKLSAPEAGPDSPVAVSRDHHTIEEHLRGTEIPHTVLRPYAFMQKLPLLAPGIRHGGVIVGTMQDAPCNYIDVRDIADVAEAALTRPEVAGGTYHLTGGETVSHPQLAERLSLLLRRPIRYVDLPPEAFREHLIRTAGMSDRLASHVAEIQRLAVTHPERPTGDVARLLGRPPRTLDNFLGEHAAAFR